MTNDGRWTHTTYPQNREMQQNWTQGTYYNNYNWCDSQWNVGTYNGTSVEPAMEDSDVGTETDTESDNEQNQGFLVFFSHDVSSRVVVFRRFVSYHWGWRSKDGTLPVNAAGSR